MLALIRHCLRELRQALIIGFLVAGGLLVLAVMEKGKPTEALAGFAVSLVMCYSPAILYSPALLYAPKFAADSWLPVPRGTLYHTKMAILFLIVGLSCGLPMLVMQTMRSGGLTIEIVRSTLTLVSWLFAGICVSAVVWPALFTRKVPQGLDIALCVAFAFIVIAYAAVAMLIGVHELGGFWLAPCVLAISVFAYRRGCAMFCDSELVPSVPEEELIRRLKPERRSASVASDPSKYPYARVPDLAEFVEAATGVRRVRSTGTRRTLSPHPEADNSPRIRSRPAARIPQGWKIPLRLSVREAVSNWVFLLPFFLFLFVFLPRRQPTSLSPQDVSAFGWFMLVWLIYGSSFGIDWGRLIRLMPGAYPRTRIFVAMTMWPVVGILLWSWIFGLLSAPGWIAAVAGLLAAHSLLLWLRVAPPPRHTRTWWFHGTLVRAIPILFVLILGLWLVGTVWEDSFAARLFQELGARVSASLADPSQAWIIAGMFALVAILLWSHAYVRFKYMEVVPPWGGWFSSTWQRKWGEDR
ncbi:MAG: hypothetical protein AB1646_12895 [Thermodesulfobacteriota bacterium]